MDLAEKLVKCPHITMVTMKQAGSKLDLSLSETGLAQNHSLDIFTGKKLIRKRLKSYLSIRYICAIDRLSQNATLLEDN